MGKQKIKRKERERRIMMGGRGSVWGGVDERTLTFGSENFLSILQNPVSLVSGPRGTAFL